METPTENDREPLLQNESVNNIKATANTDVIDNCTKYGTEVITV